MLVIRNRIKKNLGTIKSSNLCCEIIEYSSKDESAVCNLASICLPRFIKDVVHENNDTDDNDNKNNNENNDIDKKNNLKITKEFDFDKLGEITKMITRNLNKVIDINFYPIPETRNSNKRHRPIGIGVQGLADVFAILKMPFDGEEAKELNRKIFEVIYYNSLESSMDLSRKREKVMKKYKEVLSKLESNDKNNELSEEERTNMFADKENLKKNLTLLGKNLIEKNI